MAVIARCLAADEEDVDPQLLLAIGYTAEMLEKLKVRLLRRLPRRNRDRTIARSDRPPGSPPGGFSMPANSACGTGLILA